MAKGGSGFSKNGRSELKAGEEAYVKSPRGEVVVVKNENGEYVYKGYIDKSDVRVDTSSAEYKQALRDNNVKVKFNANGTVTVTSGGLFDRKRTFKTIEAFQQEANSRIDRNIEYDKRQAERTRKGIISQLHAENIRSDFSSKTSGDAKRAVEKQLRSAIKSQETRAAAAQDMKQRLARAIEEAKRKRRNK